MQRPSPGGIFSSKRLDTAYAQGREDAADGRGRSSAERVAKLSFGQLDFWLPGGQARFHARLRSYSQGYEDELRVYTVAIASYPAELQEPDYEAGRLAARRGGRRLDPEAASAMTVAEVDAVLPGVQSAILAALNESPRHAASRSHPSEKEAQVAASYDQQLELLHDLSGFLSTLQGRMEEAVKSYESRLSALHDAGLLDNYHDFLSRQALQVTQAEMKTLVTALAERDQAAIRRIAERVEAHRDELR